MRWQVSTWACVLAASSCVIGTWPTPEDRNGGKTPSGIGGRPELCDSLNNGDGIDNDGDGAVDEGCRCAGTVRGCIGMVGDACGFGLQYCVGGLWQDCTNISPPYYSARPPDLRIVDVAPATLTRGAL